MKNNRWLLTFALVTVTVIFLVSLITAYVDPYMHFHKPLTDQFYYSLNNQRSQNDGIVKQFDYDTLITGTSMVENFRTSEADKIFECHSIKVPYFGGSFKETNDILKIALHENQNIKYVIRGLDQSKFIDDKERMRYELGKYPTYLYDKNPFNDVEYLLNRDVLYTRVMSMIKNAMLGEPAGITSFDSYSNWMSAHTFGKETVLKTVFSNEDDRFKDGEQTEKLTDAERKTIHGNVKQNITHLADEYPDTTFYYFLTPYSAAYWGQLKQSGTLIKQIEVEKYALSLIVQHENIHIFGWNRFDLLDDLNNYKDPTHYGDWINSWILSEMRRNSGRITQDNYQDYIKELQNHYMNFDFNTLFEQIDNEADYYNSGLLNVEISGREPIVIDRSLIASAEMKNANVVTDQFNGADGIECYGTMTRDNSSNTVETSMLNGDYCGLKFMIDVTDCRALTFYGKKVLGCGQPTVSVYDSEGKLLKKLSLSYNDLDNEWHQYLVKLNGVYGNVTIIMNGGYTENSGPANSKYVFSNIILY